MMPLPWHAKRLQMRLARYWPGWTCFIGLFLCLAGIVLVFWAIPAWRQQVRHGELALARMQQGLFLERARPASPLEPALALEQKRLREFHAVLGQPRHVEQQLATMFALAGKHHVTARQAQYLASHHRDGRYATLRITLPVEGSYTEIRQFVEGVLLAVPFASLDGIILSRDTPARTTLEATLRFTLFLEDETGRVESGHAAVRDGAP
jgi:hypothetical protein